MSPERNEFKFLGTVEAVFSISGRGVVIVPVGVSDLGLGIGDSIQLRAPLEVAKEKIVDGMEIWI